MKNINENIISCFFPTSINDENYINCTIFKEEENFEIIKTTQLKIEGSLSDGLKSEVMSTDGRQKVLLIFFIKNNQFLFYAGYDINSNSLIMEIKFVKVYIIHLSLLVIFHILRRPKNL